MLELLSSGVMTVWLTMAGAPQLVNSSEGVGWQNTPWLGWTNAPDAIAQVRMQQYLAGLAGKGLNPETQGIWLQSGPLLLASNRGTTPVPAASLTKVATTIAALHHWGPDHRFETRLSATGPVQNGTLQGDLILQSDGDPIIEWEEAIALGNALNRSGVRNIAGNLVIVGNLTVSFEEDLPKSADLLKQAWSALTWSADFEYAYRSLPPGTPRPQITIAGDVQLVADNIARSPKQILLVRHQSPPLRQILKVMNVESNNTIAQVLTDAIGGTAAMSNQAATLAGVPSTEILLKNGSGLGLENRLSPRAVCALFAALQRLLQSH
ncbi:MAG TPA: D-alanyl-D-alanine carboxypeptidase, partial [Thermosynechococcaceae cyanobacterium]